ncbi:MAG: helix-turn-helix domain-containing protein [Promethearchaeota archaeon]
MKFIKMKIGSEMLKFFDIPHILKDIRRIEILTTYQYSKHVFFSFTKIVFEKDFSNNEIRKILKRNIDAESLQIVEKRRNEIICFLYAKKNRGYWGLDIFKPGPWAIVPPLILTPEFSIVSLIASEDYIKKFFKSISKFNKFIKILTLVEIKDYNNFGAVIMPSFTKRQLEIGKYALNHGYFEIPKKISAEQIAKHFNLSIPTINEHLRKLEISSIKFLLQNY